MHSFCHILFVYELWFDSPVTMEHIVRVRWYRVGLWFAWLTLVTSSLSMLTPCYLRSWACSVMLHHR